MAVCCTFSMVIYNYKWNGFYCATYLRQDKLITSITCLFSLIVSWSFESSIQDIDVIMKISVLFLFENEKSWSKWEEDSDLIAVWALHMVYNWVIIKIEHVRCIVTVESCSYPFRSSTGCFLASSGFLKKKKKLKYYL